MIANEIAGKLKANEIFSEVTAVAPGFINICLTDTFLSKLLNDMYSDERLNLPLLNPKTIVVDFGGPNVAKPLHVGHLRSAIIGDSLCRLARFLGYNVIGDVHLGDWGLQMGMVIAEIKRTQPNLPYFQPDFCGEYPNVSPVTVDELNVLYPTASARAKVDEDFAKEAAQATVELQDRRAGYMALWRHIWNVSVEDLKKNYDILGVHFDKWYGESDADEYIPQVMNRLKERNLLRESDGAQVVDVARDDDKEPMPPMLIVKSNGADIYGTTDLGTLIQRMQDWNPDEIWYVVDNRQALHFKQVFRCATLSGILSDQTVCSHIGFGTMNGKDGKPYKTRDGGVMRLSDMIETVTSNAYSKANESDVIDEEDKKTAIAQLVGVAAMKIGDMVNHRTKDYIFDMERFLASEGKTGPYLQYTAVRINSVLKKAIDINANFGEIITPATSTERELMLSLISVSEALLRALSEKAPNVICEKLFEITGIFNRFYFENKILTCQDEKQRSSWLTLLNATYRMIQILLSLLGVGIPEQM
ncbi:MAG: arginine--tRNA ligase [Bacillota bacterium]|nr:arginine--tRNA ligase [Bacillota bacterium]